MLEDESGRIRLVGDVLKTVNLVTGCIIGVMGTENANGELEVIDIKFPDLPPQPDRWSLSKPNSEKAKTKDEDEDMADASEAKKGNSKIAIVSGLSFSGTDASHTLELELLSEYLLGEAMTPLSQIDVSHISRLVIAGNSISTTDRKPPAADEALPEKKAQKKYGYDASAYNPLPSQLFDAFIAELLPSIPITMLPGAQDPANASYPQQPVHPAMFPSARAYARDPAAPATQPGWFDTVTNPWEAELEGWRFLGTGGQNVDDVFKYVGSDDRLGMMEAMCRWRCCAPTAPDTLCEYMTTQILMSRS
jgi:DNA polymerase delta subunit 2